MKVQNRWRIQKTSVNWSLDMLQKYVNDGSINMNPPYQRGLVWSPEQKAKLIDSIVSGIGFPPVFLRELDMSEHVWLECLDGKQRMSTIVEFMNGGFPFEGELFTEWESLDQKRFQNALFPCYKVYGVTDAEAVEIYERINFCGVPHERPVCPSCKEPLTDASTRAKGAVLQCQNWGCPDHVLSKSGA